MSKQLLILLLSFLIITKLSCEDGGENPAPTATARTATGKLVSIKSRASLEREDSATVSLVQKQTPPALERENSDATIAVNDADALKNTKVPSVIADSQTNTPQRSEFGTQTDEPEMKDFDAQADLPEEDSQKIIRTVDNNNNDVESTETSAIQNKTKKPSKFKTLIDTFLNIFKRKSKNASLQNPPPENPTEQEEFNTARTEVERLPETERNNFAQELVKAKDNDPEIQNMPDNEKAVIDAEMAKVQEIVKAPTKAATSETDQASKKAPAQDKTPTAQNQTRNFAQRNLGANSIKEAFFGPKKQQPAPDNQANKTANDGVNEASSIKRVRLSAERSDEATAKLSAEDQRNFEATFPDSEINRMLQEAGMNDEQITTAVEDAKKRENAKNSTTPEISEDIKAPEQQKKPTIKERLKTFAQNKNLINTPEQNAKNKVETALRKEIKNIYEKQFYPSYVQDNPTEANNIKTSEKTYKEFNTDMNEAVDKIIKNLSAEDMKNIEVNTKINELSLTLQSRAEDFAQTKGIQPATLDAQRETVKKIDEQKKNKPGVAQKINDAVNKQTGKIDNYIQERGIKSAKKNVAKQEKKLQNQQQNLEKAKLKLETKAAKRNQVAK